MVSKKQIRQSIIMEVAALLPDKSGFDANIASKQTSFPNNLSSVCAVSMAFVGNHFMKRCNEMDDESSKKLLELKRSLGGGVVIMQNSIRVHTQQLPNVSNCLLQDFGMNQVPDRNGICLRQETSVK